MLLALASLPSLPLGLGAVLAALLLVYLTCALLRPEWFA